VLCVEAAEFTRDRGCLDLAREEERAWRVVGTYCWVTEACSSEWDSIDTGLERWVTLVEGEGGTAKERRLEDGVSCDSSV